MVFVADMVYSFCRCCYWTLSWCCSGGSVAGQPQSTGGSFLRGSDEPGTALDRVKCRCLCEALGLSGVEARVVAGRNASFRGRQRAVPDR